MNTAISGAIVNRRYRIAKPLGQGGMGAVFLAEDLAEDARLVALKVLLPSASQAAEIEHFKNEFQFLAQLRHPHLAEVYDFGVTRDLAGADAARSGEPPEACFFTMEYVRGDDLYLSTAGMPVDDLLELVVQVCRGLEFIHSRGFVHHDIKPANILVAPLAERTEGGPRFAVKLLDFGLAAARGLGAEAAPRGTVPYMAPELLKGLPVDRRADLYSFGIVLYQIVTRRLPFDGDDSLSVIRKHIQDEPVPPHLIRKDVPRAIESLILRLLAKEPSDRLPSANMVIQTLSMLTGKRYEIETRTTRECYIMGGRFVGREAPFLLVRDAFEHLVVRAARGDWPPERVKLLSRFQHCILLSGERGIGKHRLVQEFKHQVQLAGVQFVAVDCPAEGGAAFAPFLELFRRGLQLVQADEKLFDRYADELGLLLPDLAARRTVHPGIELEPERERVRLVSRLTDLVLEMAHRQPTVLCIRNLHWIDAMSQELVKNLAHRLHALRHEKIRAAAAGMGEGEEEGDEILPRLAESPDRLPPLLLLATYDDAQIESLPANRLVGELTAAGSAEEIRLRRLTLGETSDLVKSMLGLQLMPDPLVRLVHENAGGNPLFVEEIMRSMVEEGVIAYDRGAWRVYEERLRDFTVPAGMALLIQRRLERVRGKDLEVLQVIAACHRPVSLDAIARLVPDRAEAVQRIAALERRGLVQRAEGILPAAYAFAHASTRDLVYQQMAPERRQEFHDRIGTDLEKHPEASGAARGDADECAYHLLRGRTPARALPHLLAAADRARARFSLGRAMEGYEAALVHIPATDIAAREPVLEKLGAAYTLVGRYEDAVRAFSELISTCAPDAPAERLIGLYTKLAEACAKKGDWDRAASFLQLGFDATSGHVTPALVRLYHQHAWLLVQRGQCREGIAACEQGLALAARLGEEPLTGPLYNVLGVAHLHLGNYDQSKSFLERALEIYEGHDDPHGLGNCLNNLAILYGYTGHQKKALDEQKRVLALRERTGDRWGVVLAIGNLGVISHEMGDNDAAMEYFRRSLSLREEIGMTHGVPNILLNIGNIQFSRGRIGDAFRSWERCLDLYRRSGDPQGEAICLGNLVHLYTYCGDVRRAETELARARELANKLGLRRELAVLQSSEAEIAVAREDYAAALESFRLAAKLYRDMRSGSDLARMRLYEAEVAWLAGDAERCRTMIDGLEAEYEGTPPAGFLALLGLLRGCVAPVGEALGHLEAALARIQGEQPDLEWEIRFAMGRALEALGRADEAVAQDRQALDIIYEIWETVPSSYRDRFSSTGRRKFAWERFLRLQAEGKLTEDLDHFVIRLAVKGGTMEHREDSPEMDATRKRLQVAINLLKEENKNLVKLMEINKKLNSELDLARLLEFIMDAAVELTRAEKGFILRIDEAGKMSIAVARNFEKLGVDRPEQQLSRSIAEEVARAGKVVLTSDAAQDSRFSLAESVRDLHLASVLCVPLRVRVKILGACYIENRAARGFFSEKDRELLEAFSDQAAIAMENARLYQENLQKQKELEKSKEDVEALNRQLQQLNQNLEVKVHVQEEQLTQVKEALEARVGELGLKYKYENIVGRSPKMKDVFTLLDRVTSSTLPVVIHGESGTGKELVARAIHFNGPRKHNHFAAENCAAITETLLESELFGYMRGAFTGADKDRKGLFEVAHQGTLFLDEIGDMSAEMQKKLLRVLETGELRRVGGKDTIKVDVRIIAASNKDLFALTKENLFREDLYYRLNVFQVKLPTLRERKEDLSALVEHLMRQFAAESKTPLKKVDPTALALLRDYDWPGNIRELKNVITGVSSLTDDLVLTAKHFVEKMPTMDRLNAKGGPAKPEYLSIEEYTRRFIAEHQDILSDTDIADYLGISRKTLWEKRKKWGLAR